MISVTLRRLPLLMAGALSLMTGIIAGEGRIGWPVGNADLALLHGPLMICGFFGTVIGLERAVALGKAWGFGAPLFTALGGAALIAGHPQAGALALSAGSLVFTAMSLAVILRQREVFTAILGLGGLAWAAGNLVWIFGGDAAPSVPFWAAFLVLTIAGERLELSRFLPPWRWRTPTLFPPLALLLAGLGLGSWPLFGLGLALLTLWSLINDVVRRTIRQAGLTRYVAICLLSGYAWALGAGLLMTGLVPGETGAFYDAALHALFVGFVFSMVYGHAPVILPAILRVAVPYRLVFYLPLAVLHASLGLRVAGDLLDIHAVRQWGGLGNAAAIALFIVTLLATVVSARKR
ncbi:hypothetical protein CCC_02623 [Paramagnetospirillum magnetotacticum MS-1]|uniref:Uncharacterized protein n=1 Tax=Paramagnetospirillum magnetotacticum MS-1 TaxID=272627 RepID=A0A0C2YJ75_PARME|nr:hypothetical protein [Paramagnetospirillum magnetotacticum]KIL99834.1 hypothetical protein CCC_02623 [Paramagnetospirillum magnetotacticum MS-1]